jgi:phage gp36-like protein
MSYATRQDLIDRFGERELIALTDENGQFLVEDVLSTALVDADADIDTHLAMRYTLPLATAPVVLVRIACDLARYYLYGQAAPEHVKERHDAARELLAALASGKVSLGIEEQSEAAENLVEWDGGGQVFDRSDNGFI